MLRAMRNALNAIATRSARTADADLAARELSELAKELQVWARRLG